jgi:hypothetical protein
MARGVQGDKQEKVCHLVLKLKLVLVNIKMVEEVVPMSPIAKCSSRTKAKMAVIKTKMAIAKVKKAITKKTCEAKKVAKLVVAKLNSTKKASKMPNGRKEEMSLPLNVKSTKGGASMEKKSSTREALKDEVHLEEMV